MARIGYAALAASLVRAAHGRLAKWKVAPAAIIGFLCVFAWTEREDASGSSATQAQVGKTAAAPGNAPAAHETTAPTEPAPVDSAEPPFVLARKEACKRYDAVSNEVKKSAVFSEYFHSVTDGLSFTGLVGKLDDVSTPTGGSQVTVKVEMPWGTISNVALFDDERKIAKGSDLYNAIGDLEVGSQVSVTAVHVSPDTNPFSERLGVCGNSWTVTYKKIEPAK
jgi:hypothetical protein